MKQGRKTTVLAEGVTRDAGDRDSRSPLVPIDSQLPFLSRSLCRESCRTAG